MTPLPRVAPVAALLMIVLAGCGRDSQDVRGGGTGNASLPAGQRSVARATDTTGLPAEGALAQVAIGDIAGTGANTLATLVENPYASDPAAVAAGKEQFVKMNCAACHGYTLKGGMGPNLTDTYWRYGGAPADIYKSIFEGRPQGMPAWGRMLPPSEIWKIVAYIQSKGGTFPPSLADRARQGDLATDEDTTSFSTLKGRNNAH